MVQDACQVLRIERKGGGHKVDRRELDRWDV